MDKYIFKQVKSFNASSYLSLREQSQLECPEFVGLNVEKELATPLADLGDMLDDYPNQGVHIIGAFTGNSIVGVVSLSRIMNPKFKHKFFVWGMYISNEHRGKGLAKDLMLKAKDVCKLEGGNIMRLQVTTSNSKAIQLYELLGFQKCGVEKKALFLNDIYYDFFDMEIDVLENCSGLDNGVPFN